MTTFFTIMGVIFTIIMVIGAVVWYATEDFAEDRRASNKH